MNRCWMAAALMFMVSLGLEARTQASLSASSTEASVGDPVMLRVIVQTNKPHDRIRVETGSGGDVWEETSPRQVKSRELDGLLLREIHITLAFFRTGSHRIGPFRITLEKNSLPVEEIATNMTEVHIVSVLTEKDNDIADIKPPIPIRGNPLRLLPWIAGLVLLPLGLILLLAWLRRRRPSASPPPPHPLEELEQELARLMGLGLFSRGRVKEFCLRLTPVLKRFLNRVYHFNAGEMTTRETLLHLARNEEDAQIREHLALLLNLSDRVKFARFQPGPAGEAQLAHHIRDLISRYRERQTPQPEESSVSPGA
ncbi:MAG: hypothetical protein RB296_06385 [Acidobacteriota bacterium]|nr:hypothetical protein [Acidobacteriota bacterium]